MILIFVLYMLFASTFTLGKAVLAYMSPVLFIGIRMLGGGSLLLGYQYFLNKDGWKLHRRDLFFYLQIMLFHVYIAYVAEFWALQYISSAKACLLYSLSPFLTAIFSYFVLAERMTSKKWFGLILGFSAFLPLLVSSPASEHQTGSFSFLSFPECALLISVTSAVYGWIIFKRLLRDEGYSPVMVNGIGMFGGGILAFITSLFVEGSPQVAQIPMDRLGQYLSGFLSPGGASLLTATIYTILLIVVANVVCYNLYGYLLRCYSATFLSFAGFTTPLFAGLFGWFLFGEKALFSLSFLVTVSGVFLGLYIFYQEELKNN